ncbi:hypothetical protein TNCV_3561101 [Trichonephila clavipes]|nr:hypothetical protein TNCV_3561101 [Trichonephila clavipes]
MKIVQCHHPEILRNVSLTIQILDNAKQKVFILCTQWLSIPSYQMPGPCDDMVCNQVTGVLLGVSRQKCAHHDSSSKTQIRLKRRNGGSFISSLVDGRICMLQCQGK